MRADRIPYMPRKSRLKLPPLDTGGETQGRRLARLRKTAGLTQVELAKRIGIIQALVSAYEQEKLKLSAEMAAHIAKALNITTDELVGLNAPRRVKVELSLRLARRLKKIEALPAAQRKALLKTIDAFLRAAKR